MKKQGRPLQNSKCRTCAKLGLSKLICDEGHVKLHYIGNVWYCLSMILVTGIHKLRERTAESMWKQFFKFFEIVEAIRHGRRMGRTEQTKPYCMFLYIIKEILNHSEKLATMYNRGTIDFLTCEPLQEVVASLRCCNVSCGGIKTYFITCSSRDRKLDCGATFEIILRKACWTLHMPLKNKKSMQAICNYCSKRQSQLFFDVPPFERKFLKCGQRIFYQDIVQAVCSSELSIDTNPSLPLSVLHTLPPPQPLPLALSLPPPLPLPLRPPLSPALSLS
jgi:hypothetical protein